MMLVLRPASADMTTPTGGDAAARPSEEVFDLDGDGRPDRVEMAFSGGAHCCYSATVHLTGSRRPVPLPFWFDGGSFPLANPRFKIFTQRGGGEPPETVLNLEIATYNGVPQPIPRAWRERYGVRSHHIAVHLRGGRLRVENLLPPPAPPPNR